jgi:hypothetical protein
MPFVFPHQWDTVAPAADFQMMLKTDDDQIQPLKDSR